MPVSETGRCKEVSLLLLHSSSALLSRGSWCVGAVRGATSDGVERSGLEVPWMVVRRARA